jgi:hypothetical protein
MIEPILIINRIGAERISERRELECCVMVTGRRKWHFLPGNVEEKLTGDGYYRLYSGICHTDYATCMNTFGFPVPVPAGKDTFHVAKIR